MPASNGKAQVSHRPKDPQKTLLRDTRKNTSFRSSSVAMKRREDVQSKASRSKRLSSFPRSQWKNPDVEPRPQSCTFRAVKMADDVLMSPAEVQRVRPIVRKSSSSEPKDVESNKIGDDEKMFWQTSRQHEKSSLLSFGSSGATVNTSLVTPTSDLDDSDDGNVFLSPEREYVLVPPTVIQSLEVEAIHFQPELVVLFLEWNFFKPEK